MLVTAQICRPFVKPSHSCARLLQSVLVGPRHRAGKRSISTCTAAAMSISVSYGNHSVTDGTELTKAQTHAAPDVKLQAKEGALTTLLMTDPDAPSRAHPTRAEWMHWMVTNIDGGDVASGDTVVPYNGPAPPAGTGHHRYIFTLYEQRDKIEAKAPEARNNFDSKAFAAKHHLTSLASVHFVCETK